MHLKHYSAKGSTGFTRLTNKLKTEKRLRRNSNVNVPVVSYPSQNTREKPERPSVVYSLHDLASAASLITPPTAPSQIHHDLSRMPPPQGLCTCSSRCLELWLSHFTSLRKCLLLRETPSPSSVKQQSLSPSPYHVITLKFDCVLFVCTIVCFPYQSTSFIQASVLLTVLPRALGQDVAQSCAYIKWIKHRDLQQRPKYSQRGRTACVISVSLILGVELA